jgi:hypothetical protein
VRVLVVLALLFIGAMPQAARTSASFTSAAASSDLVFSSGSVSLDSTTLTDTSLRFSVSGLFPSDTTAQYRAFTVTNTTGTSAVNLRYSVGLYTDSDTTSAPLAQQLKFALVTVASTGLCTSALDGTAAGQFDGTSALFRGAASGGDQTGVNLVGTRAVTSPVVLTAEYAREYPTTASEDRALAAGSSEILCLRVRLPSNTKSTAQGGSSSFSLRFVALQDAGLYP